MLRKHYFSIEQNNGEQLKEIYLVRSLFNGRQAATQNLIYVTLNR